MKKCLVAFNTIWTQACIISSTGSKVIFDWHLNVAMVKLLLNNNAFGIVYYANHSFQAQDSGTIVMLYSGNLSLIILEINNLFWIMWVKIVTLLNVKMYLFHKIDSSHHRSILILPQENWTGLSRLIPTTNMHSFSFFEFFDNTFS